MVAVAEVAELGLVKGGVEFDLEVGDFDAGIESCGEMFFCKVGETDGFDEAVGF